MGVGVAEHLVDAAAAVDVVRAGHGLQGDLEVLRAACQRTDDADVALLDTLVAAKLKTGAEAIAAEGWKWIEVAADFPYGHTQGLRQIDGVAAERSADEQATIDKIAMVFGVPAS